MEIIFPIPFALYYDCECFNLQTFSAVNAVETKGTGTRVLVDSFNTCPGVCAWGACTFRYV